MAAITYPNYPDEGLWAVLLADGTWLKMPHGNLPVLFQYKWRAQNRARFIHGSLVVPVKIKALPWDYCDKETE